VWFRGLFFRCRIRCGHTWALRASTPPCTPPSGSWPCSAGASHSIWLPACGTSTSQKAPSKLSIESPSPSSRCFDLIKCHLMVEIFIFGNSCLRKSSCRGPLRRWWRCWRSCLAWSMQMRWLRCSALCYELNNTLYYMNNLMHYSLCIVVDVEDSSENCPHHSPWGRGALNIHHYIVLATTLIVSLCLVCQVAGGRQEGQGLVHLDCFRMYIQAR